jgi:hypothetical protein
VVAAAANASSIGEDAVPLYKNFNILHLNLRLQFVSIFDGYRKKRGPRAENKTYRDMKNFLFSM